MIPNPAVNSWVNTKLQLPSTILHISLPHFFPLLPLPLPLGPLALPVWLTRPELALFAAAD
jgi:hypothetical protein